MFFFPSNVKLFSRLFLQHTIPWTPWLVSSLYDSVHPSNLAISSFQVKIKKNIFKCFCYNTTQTRNRNPGSFPTDRLLYVQVDFFFFYVIKVQGERLEQLPCHFHPASVSALLTSPPGCLHTSLCVRGWDCASSPQRSITQAAPVFVLIPSVTCSL